MSIRQTFSNAIGLAVIIEYDKGAVMQISTVLGKRLPCCLLKGPVKRDFLDIYLTTFSESVISKIQNLGGSSFFKKYLKFNLDFKNAAKNSEKVFCFWDNCIWIGIVKLSLLRTGYFSSVANVLTSSPKIWHVNKRDFFEQNFLASDQ